MLCLLIGADTGWSQYTESDRQYRGESEKPAEQREISFREFWRRLRDHEEAFPFCAE